MKVNPYENQELLPFVIAEIGINHNGSVDIAKKLIDMAKDCGADAVKLQTFKAFECAGAYSETASYQKGECQNQLDLLKSLKPLTIEYLMVP